MTPAFTAFNGGELSPLMEGRIDFNKYASGAQTMVNFIPTVQGPIRRRQGSRFVHEVKTSSNQTWLARFQFNVTQAFILEFGNQYIRFYTDHGIVETAPDTPYEIASPYTAADLVNPDGTFRLSMVQSADVIYIAHPDFPPRKLSRFGNTNWTLTVLDAVGGPFDDINKDDTITVYASAETGSVTLTASSSIFTADDVGSLFYLEQRSTNQYVAWEVNREFPQNTIATSDGKFYKATSTFLGGDTKQYSGSVRPTHIEGKAFDGSRTSGPVQQETSETIGIEWEFLHPGFGWVEITAFTSGTQVTATVKSRLPAGVVGASNATYAWAYGDWSERMGYPSHVTFFRERLTFAGKQKLWFSVTGDFENFQPKKTNTVADDDSVNIRISSDQVNDVTWLVSGNALLVGTAGGEFACSENSTSDPFATRNAKITQQSRYGGRSVAPEVVSSQTLFVQAAGRKIRQLAYSFDQDSYASTDLTVLAEHITEGSVLQMAYQQEPDSIAWMVRGDGTLLGFTYNVEQGVTAWHRHQISGDFVGGGAVESIQVISTPDGTSQELWMIVRRTINGATKRYVEYVTQTWEGATTADAVFVDSSLEYSGVPITTVAGLDHLEGATVRILADGSTHPDKVVVGGEIELDRAASVLQIGLPYTSTFTSMRLEQPTQQGTSQSKQKKFSRVFLRFLRTVGAKYGSGSILDELPFRSSADGMDEAVAPFTGDRECSWQIGWERPGRITVVQDQALPLTLVGIYPDVQVGG